MAQTHARKTDPVSSHEAAQSNAAIRHIQVYEVVRQLGGEQLTTAEVARKADLDRHLVAKRMPRAAALSGALDSESAPYLAAGF